MRMCSDPINDHANLLWFDFPVGPLHVLRLIPSLPIPNTSSSPLPSSPTQLCLSNTQLSNLTLDLSLERVMHPVSLLEDHSFRKGISKAILLLYRTAIYPHAVYFYWKI
ncbi:unnamed protein product [Hymenolepis diminuta]|uniref:Uncharacterized protein n=1 Tax=Hymenolepis diminuta TaxID=6216 RepID=A0A564YHD3_HYMDI|nr:unnamed protein product [Hymenolepis diminuta]